MRRLLQEDQKDLHNEKIHSRESEVCLCVCVLACVEYSSAVFEMCSILPVEETFYRLQGYTEE